MAWEPRGMMGLALLRVACGASPFHENGLGVHTDNLCPSFLHTHTHTNTYCPRLFLHTPYARMHTHTLAHGTHARMCARTTCARIWTQAPAIATTPSPSCPSSQLNGSLARAAIRELISKNLIRPVAEHAHQKIYTRAVGQ